MVAQIVPSAEERSSCHGAEHARDLDQVRRSYHWLRGCNAYAMIEFVLTSERLVSLFEEFRQDARIDRTVNGQTITLTRTRCFCGGQQVW